MAVAHQKKAKDEAQAAVKAAREQHTTVDTPGAGVGSSVAASAAVVLQGLVDSARPWAPFFPGPGLSSLLLLLHFMVSFAAFAAACCHFRSASAFASSDPASVSQRPVMDWPPPSSKLGRVLCDPLQCVRL